MQAQVYQPTTDVHSPSRPPAGKLLSIRRRTGRPPAAILDAVEWLQSVFKRLASVPARIMREQHARLSGRFSWRSVERAKAWLGISSRRLNGKWLWKRWEEGRQKPLAPVRRLLAVFHNPAPAKKLELPTLVANPSLKQSPTSSTLTRRSGYWHERIRPLLNRLGANAQTRRNLWNQKAGDAVLIGACEHALNYGKGIGYVVWYCRAFLAGELYE